MSLYRRTHIAALVLMTLSIPVASAAVKLDIPDVPARDIPVMIQLTALSAKLHGSSGSHRGPLFVEPGKATTVQPPLGNPLTATSTWIDIFHPDSLPVGLASSDYAAVIGYHSVRDITLLGLDALQEHPTLFLTGLRRQLPDGWTLRINPRIYAGRLLEQLDALGATPQRVARYRTYFDRYRSIIEGMKDAERLCPDLHEGQQTATPEAGDTAMQELASLCAETDPATRESLFQDYWQRYFGNTEAQLRQVHLRLWTRLGPGAEHDAFIARYFTASGAGRSPKPLREVWGEAEVARLLDRLGQPQGPPPLSYRPDSRPVLWEEKGGLIRYWLRAGGLRHYVPTDERCAGFSYRVDASRYFAADLPDTKVQYDNQWFCYDPASGKWDWPAPRDGS